MDALDVALQPEDMNIPGFGFHGLEGKPKRYGVSVTGNWRRRFFIASFQAFVSCLDNSMLFFYGFSTIAIKFGFAGIVRPVLHGSLHLIDNLVSVF